jgi:hypothetical protein
MEFFTRFLLLLRYANALSIYKMLNNSDTTKLVDGKYTWIIVLITILIT